MHPDLGGLGVLVGIWEGGGSGTYPTIEDFAYRERIVYERPPGKGFVAYRQQTWRADGHPGAGTPMHTESGYLRPGRRPGDAELVLAQPTGITEVHHGTIRNGSLALTATSVQLTDTAKEVTSVERRIEVDGDDMSYELWIGAVGQPHQIHLRAALRRTQ